MVKSLSSRLHSKNLNCFKSHKQCKQGFPAANYSILNLIKWRSKRFNYEQFSNLAFSADFPADTALVPCVNATYLTQLCWKISLSQNLIHQPEL